MQLLHCENLSFSYDGKVAVKDVTFSISSGEYICIVGENGSGKSTLVKGLLQLHPPSGGTLRLGDCLKGGIGYLPQQKTSWKHFPASVLEVTLSGCLNRMKLRPFYGKKEKQQAMENLERMGIAHLHRHCFRELSGGQQQRVLLARALCAAKHLLILDEPFVGLDPEAFVILKEQMKRLCSGGSSILFSSHILDVVEKVCNKVSLIKQGCLLYSGSTSEMAGTKGLEKVFMEMNGDERR